MTEREPAAAPGWLAAKTVCRVCGNVDVSVYPAETDDDALECDRCHQATAEAVAYVGPDGIVRDR